jgi:TonB family protein
MAQLRTISRQRRQRMQAPVVIEHPVMALPEFAEKQDLESVPEEMPLPVLAAVPQLSQTIEVPTPKGPSDLALDLVLNEIVLQARLTTNATGAVFGMRQDAELVCRATTGATAVDVSPCLKVKAGIAENCFATAEIKRVDDLGPDTNADAVAYRRSGVRSILVVPVQGEKAETLGILEIFSPRANAFCERDVMTLQALARRIAVNVELVQRTYGPETSSSHLAHARVTQWPAKLPKTSPIQNRRPRLTLTTPNWMSIAVQQSSKLKSVDWISILTKSSIVLALFGGTIVARSCWEQDGGMQAIRAPLSRLSMFSLSRAPANHSPLPDKAPFRVKAPGIDISTWPSAAATHPSMKASITIQRQPLVRSASSKKTVDSSSVEEAEGFQPSVSADVALPNTHSESQGRTQPQPESKKPEASVPNTPADKGIEVLTTQAAMARLVQRIEPEYPNAARQQHISGTVILDVIVNETGTVDGLSMVSGESQLMIAAAQAVRQWKFEPLMKKGQPIKFESRISIDFTLVAEGH